MPWVRKGRKIYKRVGGRLKLVQTTRSVANAKHAMNARRGAEHGWKPTKKRR